MHICLLTAKYPPASTEGIPRQRQILATELARRGHRVDVVTCGKAWKVRQENGLSVHEVPSGGARHYSSAYPGLDDPLSDSHALYEVLCSVMQDELLDIIDVPLWSAQGFVTLERCTLPTVLWLQTTNVQLLAIHNQEPSTDLKGMLGLERRCLERADGILADSKAALDSTINDYQVKLSVPLGVAHLGLPSIFEIMPERREKREVEALIVGRLEKRKGTQILFEVLPGLMNRYPQLTVRFVGFDNSGNDGWKERHGLTYPAFFRSRYPELVKRVKFDGYVEEEHLNTRYVEADLLIAPSLYESFGLVYLEAMRAGLPVVAFEVGGACEIFPDGKEHGAYLIPLGEKTKLSAAISTLIEEPKLRRELGARGLARFKAAFRAEAMADATIEFYKKVIAHKKRGGACPRKVYQVMEALDVGDAVSIMTRRNASFIAEYGQSPLILSRWAAPEIHNETLPLNYALKDPDSSLIFHYWNYNPSTWLLYAVNGRKAVHYHNITPAKFFSPDSELFENAVRGYAQLEQIADIFDLIVGDSKYNIREFARHMSAPKPAIHLYPVIDVAEVRNAPCDERFVKGMRSTNDINVVFAGRIARNKRQERIMEVFDYYYREINRHAKLWLVGNDQQDTQYRRELEELRNSMKSRERIIFTGKVSHWEAYDFCRAADILICASEHEGFCMPLIEAMAFDVPVLAFAAAAVPETMGDAGILINKWDAPRVAELMHIVLNDKALRAYILENQRKNLLRFSAAEARARICAIVTYLLHGELGPLITSTERLCGEALTSVSAG